MFEAECFRQIAFKKNIYITYISEIVLQFRNIFWMLYRVMVTDLNTSYDTNPTRSPGSKKRLKTKTKKLEFGRLLYNREIFKREANKISNHKITMLSLIKD